MVSGWEVPAPTSRSSGCCSRQPCDAQNDESLRIRSWNVTQVRCRPSVVPAQIAEDAIRFQRLLEMHGDEAAMELLELLERPPLGRQLVHAVGADAARSSQKRHCRFR